MTAARKELTSVARSTVVIPARNAADTIEETLASIRAQSRPDWQAIVVDDGSTDATAEIVERLAAADHRISLIRGSGRGPGAARNLGVQAATTEFISFLDADDLLLPAFLDEMLAPFDRVPNAAATYTGWLRLAPDGTTERGPCPDVDGDLFDLFAAACVFPPHACVIRRAIFLDAGGFDEAPTTTEDWDLWQRVARTGAWFVHVEGPLVVYRMRPGSRSRDSRRVLADGLAVINQGHAPDPRVKRPHPAHAAGRDSRLRARAAFNHLGWAAGMAIAAGDDPLPLLEALAGSRAPDLDAWEVGGSMLEAMRVTRCVPPSAALSVLAPEGERVMAFLDALERATGAPGLATRTEEAIDQLAVQQDRTPNPRTSLITHHVDIELAAPIADLGVPVRAKVLSARCSYGGERLGQIKLPIVGGRVTATSIRDAVVDAAAWPLLERFLGCCVYPAIGKKAKPMDAGSWADFVQELFGMRGRTLAEIYGAGEHGEPAASSRELCLDVTDDFRDLRVQADSVVVHATVGGAPLGDLVVSAVDGMVAAGRLRMAFSDSNPDELVRLVAREGIVGWSADGKHPLRERLARARAAARVVAAKSTPD